MLWSLIKILIFLALVAALAWGAGWLLEADGGVRVAVMNTEFTLGPLESVIALAVLVLAVWIVFKLVGLLVAFLRFLNGDETAIRRYFARQRERKGYDALAEGMMALASGEGRVALAKAERAQRYLERPELTTLLTAQAAEQAGDRKRAEDAWKSLLADDRTRFVAVRGLMKQKLDEGDTDTAMKLAEKAFALKPRHEETQDLLLRLQAEQHDWGAARKTLGAKLKYGHLPRDVHRRRDAVLALGEAKDVLDEGNSIEAREAAIAANRQSPDLIPAAVMASDAYVEQGKPRYAARVIRKAWDAQPHPDLAAAFARIEPDENPDARLKRFRVLTGTNPDHPETRMLLAELLIAAEDFPGARRALGDLPETDPTARVLTIMAAIERGTGSDDAVVKGWLARALTAPRGPQWVCDTCQKVHSDWTPICDNCEGFDTLSWRRPRDHGTSLPAGAEMLPLIVGQIAHSDGPDEEGVSDPEPAIEGVVEETPSDTAEPADDEPEGVANADAPPADYARDGDADAEDVRKAAT